jgi:hypothetical protein
MMLIGGCITLTVIGRPAAAAQDAAAAPSASAPAAPAVAGPGAASAEAPGAAAASARRSAQAEAGEPRAGGPQPAAAAVAPARSGSRTATTAAPPAAADRLDLGSSTVTGNQELPKVMYIVPWKKSDIGDLAGKPMNSLLDEVLAPVDRDVFRREVRYYDAVKADAAPGAKAEPAPQVEK